MKWIILVLVFIGGIFYLINQKKQEENKNIQIQKMKAEQTKTLEILLPDTPKNDYLFKLSKDTISTLKILTEDTNEKVRISAAELLWKMQDKDSPVILKKMIEEETETAVKVKIIDMISKDKSKLSLSILNEALKNYDKDTRLHAAEVIGEFSNEDAIKVLNLALQDYDEDVKLKALESINKIKTAIEQHREEKLRELTQPQPLFRVE